MSPHNTPPQALAVSKARQALQFIIPIVPVGQMRARNSARNGFAKTYKHKKQASREITLNAFLAQHQPPCPLLGALLLGVRIYLPIPASKPKKWKQDALAGITRPVVKPDLDNAIKHLQDCMTQMRFWGDDKQIVGYLPNTGKYYSDSPRWEVEIVQYAVPPLKCIPGPPLPKQDIRPPRQQLLGGGQGGRS